MVERTLLSFPSQLQLIERLQHLLYLSSSMVFISGEKGGGKSTLIEQLSNQLPNQTQQAFITLSEPSTVTQVRQQIISQLFEQPLFDADDRLTSSLLLLKEKQSEDVARVVVIDNAHLLPEQILIELAEVIKQKEVITDQEINFILLSDESTNKKIIDSINISVDNQSVATLAFKLAPLSDGEAKQLLNHRFAQVGYSAQVEHKDALTKQLLACQGVPEKILSLATKLSSGQLETKKPLWLKTRFPAILLMLLLVAIAGVLASYLYPLFIKNREQPEALIEEQVKLLEEIQVSEIVTEAQSVAESTELLAGKWSNNKNAIENNQLSVGVADSGERVTIPESEIAVSNKQKTALVIEESQVLEQAEPSVAEESFSIERPTVDINQPKPPQKTVIEAVKPATVIHESALQSVEAITAIESNKQAEVVVLTESSELEESVQVEKRELVREVAQKSQQNNSAFTNPALLLEIKSNIFTLQLSGMSTEKALQEFIKQYQLPRKNVYLYQTLRNGKPWYVVIYGQFKTRQAANLVAKKLPGSLAKLDSWVKKYASVHRDLMLNE
ncbi:MAG: AAA family ATPase [Psychromonas sp.]|nr:AAA family ATPase [Alteromonadales bacterium]MCP5078758.1 AAA family ATPase [Psychromonas sp.]